MFNRIDEIRKKIDDAKATSKLNAAKKTRLAEEALDETVLLMYEMAGKINQLELKAEVDLIAVERG
ncbi:hypothetical protein [Pseudoalteromonas sp. MMG005]|uniref:hypothetical protein n=1 Tax=Pseudoalteromonas sp. MMG005 TaxID=2822682 RepID=UPI001B3A221D|nr:hypothetical protein [Pseudoalteromonas sp. MMG005]MBQ4844402.1 hypothetical protein [Pseudoalteromonas sp. MMG005]